LGLFFFFKIKNSIFVFAIFGAKSQDPKIFDSEKNLTPKKFTPKILTPKTGSQKNFGVKEKKRI